MVRSVRSKTDQTLVQQDVSYCSVDNVWAATGIVIALRLQWFKILIKIAEKCQKKKSYHTVVSSVAVGIGR